MMSPLTPQQNAKRYWGEEKNLDSIYTIYLKKISYSNNYDVSPTKSFGKQSNNRRCNLESSSSASSNDLAKLAANQSDHINNSCSNKYLDKNNSVICQKTEESPRGRKNFFQKYRRRSCSMDKYSFEKHHQKSSTPIKQNTKTMRFTQSSKKPSHLNEDLSASHDELDSLAPGQTKNSLFHLDKSPAKHELQKSMHDLSSQSLQWETRQVKVLQAATLDHVMKFILLINSSKDNNGLNNLDVDSSETAFEEERNNVAHTIHVLFCTYRIYTNPLELMLKLMDYSDVCRIEQYRFVMHYWMDNYPEDFNYIVDSVENDSVSDTKVSSESTTARIYSNSSDNGTTSMASINKQSIASFDSSGTTRTAATSDSENSIEPNGGGSQSGSDNLNRRLSNLSFRTDDDKSGVPLVNELLRLCRDDYIRKRAIKLIEHRSSNSIINGTIRRSRQQTPTYHSGLKNSAILDMDSRFVAQQLTAIDLDNFLNLRPYSLLEGTKSDKNIQSMVKNFNLLSRHVVITILKSHNPNIVTSHWISIAMNLRKIKNFNSLKAIIAGLTNESIYRLKQVIWAKLDRTPMSNFKLMASIVDDVNNQIVLRQTQLIVEGTAKMSIEDDSFGTIPYLGTFLTDLNMIDARYPNYVISPKDETSKLKLINFEKCTKQFEILTQVQLLQKNVLASLHAIQRRNHFDEQTTLNRSKVEFNLNHQVLSAKPAIPQVSRLFENWFYDNRVASMTDKQCYEISLALEQNSISR